LARIACPKKSNRIVAPELTKIESSSNVMITSNEYFRRMISKISVFDTNGRVRSRTAEQNAKVIHTLLDLPMKTIFLVGIVAVLAIGLSISSISFASDGSAGRTFTVHLSASPGVVSKATGQAVFQLSSNGQSLSYKLMVTNIKNVFMAHIHLSATSAILLWLYPNPNTVASGGEKNCLAVLSGGPVSACPGYKAGSFSGVLAQGTLDSADLTGSTTCYGCLGVSFAALVSDLEAGEAYVNVHTTQYPAGELSGQIGHHPPFNFHSSLAGSYPGITIAGVPSGGAPWTVSSGHVSISPKGKLNVSVKGLLIYGTGTSADGTVGPVTKVLASLVCSTSSGPSIVADSSAVSLSSMGNANIDQGIAIPSTCFAPQVLLVIAATTSGPVSNGPWIAATGLTTN
jgi:hypothetical protein